MAELGVAAGAVGIISLGIQVCQGFIQYYGSWKDAPQDAAQMCKSVRNLEEILEVLKVAVNDKRVATQAEMRVQNSIYTCAVSIDELRAELVRVQGVRGYSIWSKVHGQGRRLLYPFRQSTLLKVWEIVDDIRENLSLAVNVLHLQVTTNSEEQMGHMSAQINNLVTFISSQHNDQESRDIINWLSPLSFLKAQNDTLRRRQDGTGEWIFDTLEFKAWLAGAERILWCSGLPGAGKTILASAIIDKLQTQLRAENVGLAFVYCNYKERDTQTLANLIGSLVQQLVQCDTTVPDEVRTLYAQYNPGNIRPSEEEFSSLLQSLISRFSHVYVVVDALDECEQRTRGKFIKKLQESPANLHLLCTSRHVGDIQEALAKASHLEIRASEADVAIYLKAEILQVDNLVKFCKKVPDLQSSIIQKLVEKSNGMFLLAELHLESLKTKANVKLLRKALDILPEERDKTYEEALERIQRQPKDQSRLAMRVLSWITHAVRPLRVGEIQHAIAVMDFEPEDTTIDEEGITDEVELITVCGGIVVIDQDSRVIRLVHYTTQEYFDRHLREIFPNAQLDISRACLRYLSMDPFKDGACITDVDLKSRLKFFEFILYTSRNWGTHAFHGLDEETEERALRFLEDGSLISSAVQAKSLPATSLFTRRLGDAWSQQVKAVPGIVIAAGFGLTRLVEKILKLRNDIEEKGGYSMTALLVASSNGHHDTVRLLLENRANVKAKDSESWTALHFAANGSHKAVVQLLLDMGADIKAKNRSRWTALHIVAESGNEAIGRLLIEMGVEIEAKDSLEWTALHLAARSGQEAVVRLLLEMGADIEASDSNRRTALLLASQNEYEAAVVHVLLERRADIKAKSSNGWTALHEAARNGHKSTVQLLLLRGANIEEMDSKSRTALHLATQYKHEEVVQLLLEKGANIGARDSSKRIPLLEAGSVQGCT